MKQMWLCPCSVDDIYLHDGLCEECGKEKETTAHIICGCARAKEAGMGVSVCDLRWYGQQSDYSAG